MACFIVPMTEAVVVTVVGQAKKAKEDANKPANSPDPESGSEKESRIPFTRKLKWLSNMLWGGSALLAFEHLWHGEVVPWFPFLTALSSPADTSAMLHEMATSGVAMAALISAVWGVMLLVVSIQEKKALKAQQAATQG